MIRILKRTLIVLALAAVIGVISAFLTLRASLPQLDGVMPVAGIESDISIERDAAGVPTITASTRADVAFGTGFVHAQDRFFQMDLTRRKSAGELAALIGPVALPLDRRSRIHRFRARASEVVAAMTTEQGELMRAYVDGVNAGLQSLSAKPFEYFLLRSDPEPWVIEDSLLVVYAMYLELNDERASRDVRRGFARLALPPAMFDWMYPSGTAWDAPLEGVGRELAPLPGIEVIDLRQTRTAERHRDLDADEGILPGSNNWAVGGALTADGRALLANDMHLGITTPNVFYRARLIQAGGDGTDVSGVTLPGAPVIVAGSNGKVAWGFTNSYGDWTDAVLLRPGATEDSYRTPAGERRIESISETIEVKGGEPVEFVVRETIWGPVLDDVDYPLGDIAIRWIAHEPRATNLHQLGLETVETVEDAIAEANRAGIPPQNFVVGDAAGNIGWSIAGQIPRRGAADPLAPADWSEGGGWDDWLAPEDYPAIINPASDRIWTANTRVADGEDLAKIGDGGYDLGARGGQIRDGLFARERFASDDMLAIQLDDRALFLARWRALLIETLDAEALADRPDRADYHDLVLDWLPRADAASVGYRLVRAFRTEVRSRVFAMLTEPVRERFGDDVPLRMSNQFEGPLWQLLSEQPAHLLSADYPSWREFLLAAVDANIEFYRDNFGDSLAERTWGERNTAAIQHPLSRAIPALSGLLDMPAEPLSGDGNMPRVQSPSFGASERFAVSPGDEASGYLHMPAGQSGHPLSDYYTIGHEDWVLGRPSPFLPGPVRHALVLAPEA